MPCEELYTEFQAADDALKAARTGRNVAYAQTLSAETELANADAALAEAQAARDAAAESKDTADAALAESETTLDTAAADARAAYKAYTECAEGDLLVVNPLKR